MMNRTRKITSAALSFALLTVFAGNGMLAGVSGNLSITASAATVNSITSASAWDAAIAQEKQKYPEYMGGRKCYWNKGWNSNTNQNGNENTYSTTRCYHNDMGYCSTCNTMQMNATNGYYYNENYCLYTNYDGAHGSYTSYSQCIAFACKLARDLWQTDTFIQYNIDGDGKVVYGDGTRADYTPKVGDNVRLSFSSGTEHSIFITAVNGDNVTFAQCNADNKCGIEWDRTYYNGTRVNTNYLRSHADYVERPAIAGDLNLNGRIDSGDAAIFESTVMYNGVTRGTNTSSRPTIDGAPMSAYDVNGDGYVNTTDLNQIRYGSNHPDYMRIISYHDEVSCRWQQIKHTRGFRFSDGCYYVKNNMGGASWIGAVDTEISTLTVASSVYCPDDNRWYTVNEIGYDAQGAQSGWRTCTAKCKIKTMRLPDTIKKIHAYTFEDGELERLQFAGSNPQLETIDAYAFWNCKMLGSRDSGTLDFRPAKKLKRSAVDSTAFTGTPRLWTIKYYNS